MLTCGSGDRGQRALPFAVLGAAAIIAGGLLAAAVAHDPDPSLVWMSAYLVLVVGVAQCTFGAGQALLSRCAPALGWIWTEFIVFNLGNAGVIAGTLLGRFGVVLAGTLLFDTAVVLFLIGTRGRGRGGWLVGYRALLGLILASSLVGLALAAMAGLH